MTESKTRKQQMIEDRDAGMTYKQIGEKHGVSYQYVCQVCAKRFPQRFRFITAEGCIYPNLRRWMNDEKCSRNELLRRMGFTPLAVNSCKLSEIMSGECYPRKPYIDKLLQATGMTYEKLFALEDDDG
jgi:hypothetical protein